MTEIAQSIITCSRSSETETFSETEQNIYKTDLFLRLLRLSKNQNNYVCFAVVSTAPFGEIRRAVVLERFCYMRASTT